MAEAETGGILLQIKEKQGLLASARSQERGMEQIFPSEETNPANIFISDF